jgi:hypothetical protein
MQDKQQIFCKIVRNIMRLGTPERYHDRMIVLGAKLRRPAEKKANQ